MYCEGGGSIQSDFARNTVSLFAWRELKKELGKFCQDSWHLSQDSNWTLPGYRSHAICWRHLVRWSDYWLTSWSPVLIKNPAVAQLLENFPTFYGTRRFITVYTGARKWPLFWARLIHSITPHPISLRFILILSSHLHLSVPSGLFLQAFHQNPLYTPLLSHVCYIPCSSHLHWRWLL
jgi:hypothetical protein